jgi:hypothetical protein
LFSFFGDAMVAFSSSQLPILNSAYSSLFCFSRVAVRVVSDPSWFPLQTPIVTDNTLSRVLLKMMSNYTLLLTANIIEFS